MEEQTQSRLRVRIYPTGEERWRVPITIDGTGTAARDPLYDVQFTYEPVFSFKVSTPCMFNICATLHILQVVRKSSGAVLFDTSLGGLTLADQFLQVELPWSFSAHFSDRSTFAPKQQRLWIWRTGTAQLQTEYGLGERNGSLGALSFNVYLSTLSPCLQGIIHQKGISTCE